MSDQYSEASIKAVIAIQNYYRLKSSKRKHLEEIKNELQSFNVITSVVNGNQLKKESESNLTNIKMLNYANYFLYLSQNGNVLQHSDIFSSLIRTIIKSLDYNSSTISFAGLFLSKTHLKKANNVIKRLFEYIPTLLSELNASTHLYSKHCATMVHFLISFTSTSSWKIIQSNQQIQKVLSSMFPSLLSIIFQSNSFNNLKIMLKNAFDEKKLTIGNECIDGIFLLFFKYKNAKELEDDETIRMIIELLKIPSIISKLSSVTFKKMNDDEVYKKLLQFCYKNESYIIESLQTSNYLSYFANFIDLSSHFQKEMMENLFEWLQHMYLCLKLFQEFIPDKTKSKSLAQNRTTYWHPLFGNIVYNLESTNTDAFRLMKKQLTMLWGRQFLKPLFYYLIEKQKPKLEKKNSTSTLKKIDLEVNTPSLSFGDLRNSVQGLLKNFVKNYNVTPIPEPGINTLICHLYYTILETFQNIQLDIIASITNDDLILPSLWHHINRDSKSVNFYLKIMQQDKKSESPHCSVLILFSKATVSILNLLDEKEMYEIQKPFTLNELCEIARFSNHFCFRAIWNRILKIERPKDHPLYEAMYKLLNILYNRDWRRSFTKHCKKFWNAPDTKGSCIINMYENDDREAKFIMTYLPHIIPLMDRVEHFKKIVGREKDTYASPTKAITIERTHIIEDGYRQLNGMNPKDLKNTIRVKFVNAQGLDEAGIDRDGVFKEFLELTLRQVFDPQLNLFHTTENNYIMPSPTSYLHEDHLQLFMFVGKMLAKSVYEGIVTDLKIAPVLLAIMTGKKLSAFDELSQLDPNLYKSLTYIKYYNESEDIADLDLTFSVDEQELGVIKTIDLIPGGRHIAVTNENKIRYIHTMAQYRVYIQTKEQNAAFVKGFTSVLDQTWLNFFSPHEIQFLISGNNDDINIADLKMHVHYYGGFHSQHKVIKWLWEILEKDLKVEERRLFLKFVTSCSQAPLQGFKHLYPQFSIRCVEYGDDDDPGDTLGSVVRGFFAIKKKCNNDRLPTSSTCFNLLKLPNYSKKSILLEKLRYAIHAGTGFELS
uniref:HECT-type E3 ubiquitin transferase n=1 Tax=Parastrongyloides trichosuri TaxID=131310 RepID=A0A0N5A261_PARTI